jgi:hypothetical protein
MGSSKANQIQRLMETANRLRGEFGLCQDELKRTQRKLQEERWASYELESALSRFVDWGRLERPATIIHEANRQAQLVDIFDSAASALIEARRLTEEQDND